MALPTNADLEACFTRVAYGSVGQPAKILTTPFRVFLKNLLTNYLTGASLTAAPGIAGAIFMTASAAPADGALSANQVAMYFVATNGAAAMNFKAKQADGAVKTGTVAITT